VLARRAAAEHDDVVVAAHFGLHRLDAPPRGDALSPTRTTDGNDDASAGAAKCVLVGLVTFLPFPVVLGRSLTKDSPGGAVIISSSSRESQGSRPGRLSNHAADANVAQHRCEPSA
jgi:hypothetical protein